MTFGNVSNVISKLKSDTANTSTLSKSHATMLESIQSRIVKFKRFGCGKMNLIQKQNMAHTIGLKKKSGKVGNR